MVIHILSDFDKEFDKSKNHDHISNMSRIKVPKYKGDGSEFNVYTTKDDEFGLLQFNPPNKRGKNKDIIYFEATILSTPEKNVTVGVGFDVPGLFLGGKGTGMVGWFRGSIGYHGDDGHVIDGDVESFAKNPPSVTAPPYGAGDVIGACWNITTGEVFFTNNGVKIDQLTGCKNSWQLEFAQKSYDKGFYNSFTPTVTIDKGMQCTVAVNTGDRPFLVDTQYQQYLKEATEVLTATRVMCQDPGNATKSKLDKNSTIDILSKLGPSLSKNEAVQIIELAEDRSNVGNTHIEEFLEKLRPRVIDL